MNSALSIQKQREIHATSQTVWNVLTNPVHIEQWLGVTMKTTWNIGDPISFQFMWKGEAYEDKGHVLQLEAPTVFSYDYWSGFSGMADSPENYSVITFTLTNQDHLTILQLEHCNFATPTMYEHSDRNWEEALNTIVRLAESPVST